MADCEKRAADARENYANMGVAGHLSIGGETPEDWLDSGQCTDCFMPPFNHRAGNAVQAALASSNFDDASGKATGVIYIDKATGLVTALVRFAPGAVLPDHETVLQDGDLVHALIVGLGYLVVGIAVGAIALGETVTGAELAGMAVTGLGVAVVVWHAGSRRGPHRPGPGPGGLAARGRPVPDPGAGRGRRAG